MTPACHRSYGDIRAPAWLSPTAGPARSWFDHWYQVREGAEEQASTECQRFRLSLLDRLNSFGSFRVWDYAEILEYNYLKRTIWPRLSAPTPQHRRSRTAKKRYESTA